MTRAGSTVTGDRYWPRAQVYLLPFEAEVDDDRPSPFGLVKPHCRACGLWVGECTCSDKRMGAAK